MVKKKIKRSQTKMRSKAEAMKKTGRQTRQRRSKVFSDGKTRWPKTEGNLVTLLRLRLNTTPASEEKKTWPTGTNACHCKYEKEEANQMQGQAEMGGVGRREGRGRGYV